MSIQAVAWALRQELPPVPKFILVALCERTNEETGECWPGIATVAKAVCLSERSVVTYIGALVRNGFVMRREMRGKDGRRRSNHYWIMFDRAAAPWGKQATDLPSGDDGGFENEPCANLASGEQPVENSAENEVHVQTASHGPHATVCTLHIMPEPSEIEPSESELKARAPVPPVDFNPKARATQIEEAAEQARKPKYIPVIEGSKPWQAWVKAGHPPTLRGSVKVNGKVHTGWYFDTLYPRPMQIERLPFEAPESTRDRQATGPPLPLSEFMTADDEKQFD